MTCTIVSDGTELQQTCKNEEEKPILQINQNLLGVLESLIFEGYTEFWLNCEYGIPLWAAELICAMRKDYNLKLYIAIPYEEQPLNWCEEYRDRYFSLHEKADKVVLLNKHFHPECYHDAEEHMIKQSDLLCIFGSQTSMPHAVNTAKKLGVKTVFC